METQRLLLREMNPEDFEALFRVLGDPVIMQHYNHIEWTEFTVT